MWRMTPFGALLGGLLAQAIGLRTTLCIAASGVLLAFMWVYFSPVRYLREQPQPAEEVAVGQ